MAEPLRHPGTGRPAGRVDLAHLPVRGRVASSGYVDAITIMPAGGAPKFSAVVTGEGPNRHGTARIRLVWLGQHRVPGIEAGIRLGFEGMVFPVEGMPTMYNPRYEILSPTEA
ncbi:hypothetical protein ACFQ36_14205 [Arthrobacter sp. GCM10027362]|uniref:hypothetical protein n=1 Tax=Arthrobacter sp. GCM10027362 TaxID=3273379 RepID=UPI0036402563